MTRTPASSSGGIPVEFLKGHGTENDFVVLVDPDGSHGVTDRQVVALCDRRRGLGADGVLRIVRADDGTWFMDYRNADGSVAEMCGNGARVFGRALVELGMVEDPQFSIHTRGGVRRLDVTAGMVTVSMGPATTSHAAVEVRVDDRSWEAAPIWVPNPHAVCFVDDLRDAGSLLSAPDVTPAEVFPDGVNVEFVVGLADDHISMRVHERGVGETRSCGTGAVAAAAAWRTRCGGDAELVRVDVAGGTVEVLFHPDGDHDLRGPAVLAARGIIDAQWWRDNA